MTAAAKAPEGARKRCFMITPIGPRSSAVRKQADWVYRFVSSACAARNFSLARADTMPGSAMITTRIFEAIQQSDVCIADLSGLNANVFYELGIRHSLALPAIHIAAEGTELPFDNAQHDAIFYDISSIDSMDALAVAVGRQLDAIAEATYVISNPFTAALGTVRLEQSGDSRDVIIARLEDRLTAIEQSVAVSPAFLGGSVLSSGNMLMQALQRHRATQKKAAINLDLVREAVLDIPPWRPDDAQQLYSAIVDTIGITNKAEAMTIFDERFPGLIPF